MQPSTERDIGFAVGGLLWGLVSTYHGVQNFRSDRRGKASLATGHGFAWRPFLLPPGLLVGMLIGFGCLVYLYLVLNPF